MSAERTIEEMRFEALKLAIESGLHSQAAEFVHLVEHGCLPPAASARPPLERHVNGAAGENSPARPPASILKRTAPPSPAPAVAGELSPTSTARPAPVPVRLGALPRWTPERQALLHRLMARHQPPWHAIPWHAYSDQLTALAGPPVAAPQARAWWFNVGAFHRAAAEQATREATHVQPDA